MKAPVSFSLSKQPSDEMLHAYRAPTQGISSHKLGSRWRQAHGEIAPWAVRQRIYRRANLCSGSDPAQMHRYLISERTGQIVTQGSEPMLTNFPVAMQFLPYCSQERAAPSS